jgi:Phage MuF-C-terminal domain
MQRLKSPISSSRKRLSAEVDDEDVLFGWASAVNKVICGEAPKQRSLIVGPTPEVLKLYGLVAGSITMSVAKIATCRRTHPEVPLHVWHDLPDLLSEPLAVFPSARRDGSIVILLVVEDRDNNPVLVAAIAEQGRNVILSVYGKDAGLEWVAKEIAFAEAEGIAVYKKMDFAASLPQPPVANATSSSHGLIPSDGTAKPARDILSIGKKSTNS